MRPAATRRRRGRWMKRLRQSHGRRWQVVSRPAGLSRRASRGRASVSPIPQDFGRFPKGAILVARTTNPAWTPLFYSASGLITESGGPLSHGAVTAREMRLPAVMSVRLAMTIFEDGQVVTVDGTQGTVRLEG